MNDNALYRKHFEGRVCTPVECILFLVQPAPPQAGLPLVSPKACLAVYAASTAWKPDASTNSGTRSRQLSVFSFP